MIDQYKSIKKSSTEILFKEKGSKFYGNAFPITSENEVIEIIDELKQRHPKAGHHCYAWNIGASNNHFRANDDGEPKHSAGDPILGQIRKYELSDILVVVSRIFGGTKLGVGGLISAYKETAQLALQEVEIIEKRITKTIQVQFDYAQMSSVMRVVKEKNLEVVNQKFEESCLLDLEVLQGFVDKIKAEFELIYPIKVKIK